MTALLAGAGGHADCSNGAAVRGDMRAAAQRLRGRPRGQHRAARYCCRGRHIFPLEAAGRVRRPVPPRPPAPSLHPVAERTPALLTFNKTFHAAGICNLHRPTSCSEKPASSADECFLPAVVPRGPHKCRPTTGAGTWSGGSGWHRGRRCCGCCTWHAPRRRRWSRPRCSPLRSCSRCVTRAPHSASSRAIVKALHVQRQHGWAAHACISASAGAGVATSDLHLISGRGRLSQVTFLQCRILVCNALLNVPGSGHVE